MSPPPSASAMRARLLAALGVNFSTLAQNLVTVGVVIFGVYRIAEGEMTVGALVACTIITGRAMAPLAQVAGILTRYHQARAAFDALDGVMALPVERPADARFLHRPQIRGAIAFQDVTFRYPGDKQAALERVSFAIAAGRAGRPDRPRSARARPRSRSWCWACTSRTRARSWSTAPTCARSIRPSCAAISAACCRTCSCSAARSATTSRSARRSPTTRRCCAPPRSPASQEFIARHPQGFDLEVGERGERLSGGQRQAVAVARALLLDPPILVLDEPTSAMDNDAENRLKRRLGETLAGRTLLLVTHRASLLSLVDRLIVLDGGRLVADGPKDEVLRALADGRIRAQR